MSTPSVLKSELILKSVAFYPSGDALTFTASIAEADDLGRIWTTTCPIPPDQTALIWEAICKAWGGGDTQVTLQKMIDVSKGA